MPLKSVPSYGTNSAEAPRDWAMAVIRSVSRPPFRPFIPLKGGSGNGAPTLSVFMGSPQLLELCSRLIDFGSVFRRLRLRLWSDQYHDPPCNLEQCPTASA